MGDGEMRVEHAINDLSETPWLSGIGDELRALHSMHGMPEPPCGALAAVRWPTYCEEGDNTPYDAGLRKVFAALGIRYQSGGYLQATGPGSAEWRAYQREATQLVEDWIAYSALDEFNA